MSGVSKTDGWADLLLDADRALYRAKEQGRNRAVMFDPAEPLPVVENHSVTALLNKAVETGLVSLVYQPIICMQTGETVALEALTRLQRPCGAMIEPGIFIPIAESTGQIVSLGRWILSNACRDVLVADRADTVSVNISAIQLRAPGFALYVAALLGRLGVDPSRLALEITESQAIDDFPEAIGAIRELRQIGVKIWLDDFGAGYAGLSWLKKIDFDCVKIDSTFLPEKKNKRDTAMLSDLIRLIRHRNQAIILEGVETAEQHKLLSEYSVAYVQGYHFCRPASLTILADRGQIRPGKSMAIDGTEGMQTA